MDNSAKKILLISYHFPPSFEVGGLRIANFARKLPLYNWTPYILTIKEYYLKKVDAGRLKGIEGIKIFRTRLSPTLIQGYLRLKSMYYSVIRRKIVTMEELEKSYSWPNTNSANGEKPPQRLKRYFISLFLMLPDRERNWIIPATLRAVLEIKRKKIDYILTSCPPVSVNLIGLLVKYITGVKWIADFRDPWLNSSGGKRMHVTCAISLKIERWLEKKVIQNADLLIFNTDWLRDEYKKRYAHQDSGKFVYIPNGFDPEFFSKFNALGKYDKFTISYTGSLYVGRTPEPIFMAIKKLAEEGRLDVQKIRIKLVGSCQNVDGIPTSRLVDSYGLGSAVEILDTVPYSESLEIIRRSHLALLLAPNLQFQIPAKVYDYMGVSTKVLALTDEGATEDLVNATGIGKAFRSSDISGVMEFIYQSVHNQKSLVFERDALISKFSLKSITQRLVERLNGI